MPIEEALNRLAKSRDEMVSTLTELCRIPSIGPTNGGEGEGKKAAQGACSLVG